MPLTDENRGTNADGSNSEDYCVYCYKKGEFTQDFTMSQMIEFCLQFLDQWNVQTECKLSPVQAKEQMLQHFPMQHVELFNYENLTLKTVENLFLSSRR